MSHTPVAVTAFVLFFALAAGLAVACHRLRREAEAERADQALRAAIDDLEEP